MPTVTIWPRVDAWVAEKKAGNKAAAVAAIGDMMTDHASGVTSAASPGTGLREAGCIQGFILSAQSIFPTMGAMLFVPVLPMVLAEFRAMPGADYWVISLVSIPGVCIALFSVPAGWLGDRFGRRRLLSAALAIYSVAGCAPLFIAQFKGLIVARALLGICEAVVITLSATMIADYFVGAERDRWFANISLLATLSVIVLAPAAGLLGHLEGWRSVSALYALGIVFVPLMYFFTWESTAPQTPRATRTGTTDPIPYMHLASIGLASLFGSTLLYAIVFHEGLALSALGVQNSAQIGLFTAVAGLAPAAGALAFWRLSRIPATKLLACEYLVSGVCMILLPLSANGYEFTLIATGALFGCGLILPTMLKWTVGGLPVSFRGRGIGLFQSLFAFGQFVSGLLVAWLMHNVAGNILNALGLLGGVAVVVGAVMLLSRLRPSPSKST